MTRATTQAISPFFIVSNVEQSIAFYRDKLGFETEIPAAGSKPFFRHHRPRRSADLHQVRARRAATAEPQASSPHAVGCLRLCGRPRCARRGICRSLLRTSSCRWWRSLQRAPQRTPATVSAASRFATRTATSCSSADRGTQSTRWNDIHAETPSNPTLLAAEPQLFVADVAAACEFYTKKLGFTVAFIYGEPPSTDKCSGMEPG